MNGRAEHASECRGVATRANCQERISDESLRIRQVILRFRIGGQASALNVSHYADYLAHRMVDDAVAQTHLNAFADRILLRKVLAAEGLVDDDHGQSMCAILFSKAASGKKGDMHRLEITGHHHA